MEGQRLELIAIKTLWGPFTCQGGGGLFNYFHTVTAIDKTARETHGYTFR